MSSNVNVGNCELWSRFDLYAIEKKPCCWQLELGNLRL